MLQGGHENVNGQTDRETDRQTGWIQYTPPNFVSGGIINGWVNHCEAGDLRRYRAHCDVILMVVLFVYAASYLPCSLLMFSESCLVTNMTTKSHWLSRTIVQFSVLCFASTWWVWGRQWSRHEIVYNFHDKVIKWKHFSCNRPFLWGIHLWHANSLHKGQWRGTLVFSMICSWKYGWTNNWNAGDLRSQRPHDYVTVMLCCTTTFWYWKGLRLQFILSRGFRKGLWALKFKSS